MILTKPFGQVQRHLKENAKFVFALYIPSLFKKKLTLPLLKLLITCEIWKKCNFNAFLEYNHQ